VWVDASGSRAFVPDDLRFDELVEFPDARFPEFFTAIHEIEGTLRAQRRRAVFYRLLLQRDANSFSPRLAGERLTDLAYVNVPFAEVHLFSSAQELCFARAAQYLFEHFSTHDLLRVLCQAQRRLVPDQVGAGTIRSTPVWMGRRATQVEDAFVILTPPEYVRPALERFASALDSVPPEFRLASVAMAHFQLVAIHPFRDANGRLVRAFTPALMRKLGLLRQPSLFVSEELRLRQWEYYRRLESLEHFDELSAWISFFVRVLTAQAWRTVTLLRLTAYVRSDIAARFKDAGAPTSSAIALADEVLLNPTLSRSRIAAALGLHEPESSAILSRLTGAYGLAKCTDDDDPLFQFGDIVELFRQEK